MRKCLFALCILSAAVAWGQGGSSDVSGAQGASAGSRGQGSFSFELGASGFFGRFLTRPSLASDRLTASFGADYGILSLSAAVSADNSGKYPTHQSYELGHYFDMDEGEIGVDLGWLKAYAGRAAQRDEIDSPYSLFLSSAAIPALCADIGFKAGIFSYETRWIGLNHNSEQRYDGTNQLILDRGMEYRKMAFGLGPFRFGYQESSVYLYQDFDAESFFSPVPVFIQQMALASSGRPYSTAANPNSLMGFFCEYGTEAAKAYGQLLIDDINASFLAPVLGWAIPSLYSIQTVSKLAWAVGGRLPTPYGTFGFHHGGATKYAFASTYTRTTNPDAFLGATPGPDYSILPYEYCYFPFSRYYSNGQAASVDYRDNYIGFIHGENALAFQADYANDFLAGMPYAFHLDASLEYVLNGSKSPNNPWHDYESNAEVGKPVALLDDPVLEHEIMLRCSARSVPWKGWRVNLAAEIGYIWNRLALVAPDGHPNEAWIWKPVPGSDAPVAGFTIGASYGFGASF